MMAEFLKSQLELPGKEVTPSALPANNLQALLRELQGLNHRRDMPRRVQVCRAVLELVDRESRPGPWAALKVMLANSLIQNHRGIRSINLEQAINHFQQALEVFTREAFPEQWAMTQNKLGIAFRNRISGERVDNLEQAIHHYQQSQDIYTQEAFPEQWAMTQNYLGLAFSDRIAGERAANMEQAFHHFRQATGYN